MKTATTSNKTSTKALEDAMDQARWMLDLDTLETRNRDALDFHELSVESIRRVVEMAFAAGMKAAK